MPIPHRAYDPAKAQKALDDLHASIRQAEEEITAAEQRDRRMAGADAARRSELEANFSSVRSAR